MAENTDHIVLNEMQLKSRRSRNIAIGLVCGGLVVLFYVMTWVKLSTAMLVQTS